VEYYKGYKKAEREFETARFQLNSIMSPILTKTTIHNLKPKTERSHTSSSSSSVLRRISIDIDASSESTDDIGIWDDHNPNIPALVENKSSIFGITSEDRRLLLEIWGKLSTRDPTKDEVSSPITNIFIIFWEIWPTLDETLQYMDKKAPIDEKVKPIGIIAQFIRSALETPASIIPSLQKLAAHHTILGITKSQYEKMAQAFTEAARRVLKADLTPHLQECLYSLITTLGKIISDGYEEIDKGVKSKLKSKNGSKWELIYINLKPTQLLMFKDFMYTKKYRSGVIDLYNVEEIDKNTFDKEIFEITLKNAKAYTFHAITVEKQKIWYDQISLRLRAIAVKRAYFGGEEIK